MKKKWFIRYFVPAMILALIIGTAYIFWPRVESLIHLADSNDGYDVRILRDEWGVPHIFGQTDADTAFGLAYAHAEDDFYTIQQNAAAAKGKLAISQGKDAAPIDYIVQLLRVSDVVEENYHTLSPEVQAVCDAYADGLNYYAYLHPKDAFSELFPVSGKDVVGASVLMSPMFFSIQDILIDLFDGPPNEEPEETNALVRDVFNLAYNTSAQSFFSTGLPIGSNTFSVGPSRTTEGETYLAVNSHQPWEGPLTWYEAHLHSEEGWNAVGATFPGSPVIVHGHNPNLGWAFTVNSPDMVDIYELEIHPEDPYKYRFDDKWKELEARKAPIKVNIIGNLNWTVTEEVLWSIYGPTIRRDDGTFSIRYGGYGEVTIFEQLFYMNKAQNYDQWLEAVKIGGLPIFNIGYADAEGNIYYLYNGMIPLRSTEYDWQDTLPGNTSETLWTEYIPFEDLPQVKNPPSGFIQNCNSTPFKTTIGTGNPNQEDFCPTMGIEDKFSNRMYRALELFGSNESITYEEFYNYKYDIYYSEQSDIAKIIEMLFTADLPDDPEINEALQLLRNWDMGTDKNNKGTALAIMTGLPIAEDGIDNLEMTELIDSFKNAIHTLKKYHGRLDVPWHEVNRLRRGNIELGLGGGPDILHAVYGILEEGLYYGVAGDCYVMLVAWDKEGNVRSESIHQYGSATMDENSPHFADQSPLFIRRELKQVKTNEKDIRANLTREYRPGEEIAP